MRLNRWIVAGPRGPLLALGLAGLLAMTACSGLSTSEQRMLSGGAMGAAGGAALGALTGGSAVVGAVLGGAAGTAGGYFYDRAKRK